MKFLWATLLVDNMDESLKFYEEIVGLETVGTVLNCPTFKGAMNEIQMFNIRP